MQCSTCMDAVAACLAPALPGSPPACLSFAQSLCPALPCPAPPAAVTVGFLYVFGTGLVGFLLLQQFVAQGYWW